MTTAPESRVTTLPESLPLAEAQLLSTPPAEAQLLTLPAEEQLSIPPDDTLPTTDRPRGRCGAMGSRSSATISAIDGRC
jgi:hypothetical protein